MSDLNSLKELGPDQEIKEAKPEVKAEKKELPPHVFVDEVLPVQKKKLGKTSGTVDNCHAVYLREGANIKTRPMTILTSGTKVEVNLDNSTNSFYEVHYNDGTQLLVGFCLKDFIRLG